MEVTNEILRKILSLHLGCKVYDKYSDEVRFLTSVSLDYVETAKRIGYSHQNRRFNEVQLLLVPLSSITDEDKVGLCKILYPENENWSVNMHEADNCDSFLQSLHDIEEYHLFGIKYPMQKSIEAIDYLRSKGYMLPAYSITNLFTSGIAIDPSTLTDKSK